MKSSGVSCHEPEKKGRGRDASPPSLRRPRPRRFGLRAQLDLHPPKCPGEVEPAADAREGQRVRVLGGLRRRRVPGARSRQPRREHRGREGRADARDPRRDRHTRGRGQRLGLFVSRRQDQAWKGVHTGRQDTAAQQR